MNPLILGAGLLGKEILKQINWSILGRFDDKFDFADINTYKELLYGYDTIINCIGHTDTYSDDREKHWNVNYSGVVQLTDYCWENNIKLVHISTDYVYSGSVPNASEDDVPVHCANWYGYTKLISDAYVQLKLQNYLLIRTSFKPNPFPYKFSLINQVGNFDMVNVIVKKIVGLIQNNNNGVYNVGTNLKTIHDLAPDTEPINTLIHKTMPVDVSMNIDKLNKELKNG